MRAGFIVTTLSFLLLAMPGCGTDDEEPGAGNRDLGGDPDTGQESCLDGIAWYSEDLLEHAEPVAQKDPNAFGLYDMLGNAVEWTADCYHETFDGAPDDGSAWDEEPCEFRVIRGGGYGSTARGVRVSVRDGVRSNFYGTSAPGVRCVRAPGATEPETALVTLTWVSIPAGSFEMGCSAGDVDCYDNELPSHTVTVGAFEMTATEVTQQHYFDQTNESPFTYFCPTCAATYVSWDMAKAFCEAVGGRLATEAEWEYAARAGTTTRYYCGDE